MNDESTKPRFRLSWLLVCVAGSMIGGFYGCRSAAHKMEDDFGREHLVAEYIELTEGYMRGWCKDGSWPAGSRLIFSNMAFIDSRNESSNVRIDRFSTPYRDDVYLEFWLRDDGSLSTQFVTK